MLDAYERVLNSIVGKQHESGIILGTPGSDQWADDASEALWATIEAHGWTVEDFRDRLLFGEKGN